MVKFAISVVKGASIYQSKSYETFIYPQHLCVYSANPKRYATSVDDCPQYTRAFRYAMIAEF